jgi:hypothetical protein
VCPSILSEGAARASKADGNLRVTGLRSLIVQPHMIAALKTELGSTVGRFILKGKTGISIQ